MSAWALLPAAYGDQPHMHKALDHLRGARAQLELADPHKGGHRANAIRLVDQAIYEVEMGIQYGRMHRH